MSDTSKPQDDLSIEEILGSIRRIIAEDDDEDVKPAAAQGTAEPQEIVEDQADDLYEEEEPLELTNKITPQVEIVELSYEDDVSPEPDFIAVEIAQEDPLPQPVENVKAEAPIAAPMTSVKEEKPAMTTQDDATLKDNALLSSNAAIATAAVMAKLARQAAITEDGNSNLTIEAMVKDMIRPMLREWLDANLPELVQKMVERELERLTKRL